MVTRTICKQCRATWAGADYAHSKEVILEDTCFSCALPDNERAEFFRKVSRDAHSFRMKKFKEILERRERGEEVDQIDVDFINTWIKMFGDNF